MSDKIESIQKLKGAENYSSWKTYIKNFLVIKECASALDKSLVEQKKVDNDKLQKAKSYIIMSLDKSVLVHVNEAETALEVMHTLEKRYDDKSLSRRISLYKKLTRITLESSTNMKSYIDEVLETVQKLNGTGFKVDDEILAGTLLAGLTDEFQPFIMALEAQSGAAPTPDFIISRLLEHTDMRTEEKAFKAANKGGKKGKKNPQKKDFSKVKCHACNEMGHIKKFCKKNKKSEKGDSAEKPVAFVATSSSEDVFVGKEFCNLSKINTNKREWSVDSGASSHMTPFKDVLVNMNAMSGKIHIANNETLNVEARGDATINLNGIMITIENVLYVPKLNGNLLSVSKMVSKGNKVVFGQNGCTIYTSNDSIITTVASKNGIYKIHDGDEQCNAASGDDNQVKLWHRRLGHMNYQSMLKMRDSAVTGIKFNGDDSAIRNCIVCCEGKQCKLKFDKSESKSNEILELIHTDLMGPIDASLGGAIYILTFIDDYSRKVFVRFLKSKGEVSKNFIDFAIWIQKQTGKQIKAVRSDRGKEYLNAEFNSFCKKQGIQHQTTVGYAPEQNGVAERMNRTILEKLKCLLFDAKLPKVYWAEAANYAVYVINRSITSSTGKVPDEVFFGKKIDCSNLKVFGTTVMVMLPKEKRKKLDKNSKQMIFTGFDANAKGYRCINRSNGEVSIERNVKFINEDSGDDVITVDFDADVKPHGKEEATVEDDDEYHDAEKPSPKEANTEYSDDDESISFIDDPKDKDYVPTEKTGSTTSSVSTRSAAKKDAGAFKFNFGNLAIEINDPMFAFSADEELHNEDPVTVAEIYRRKDKEAWKKAMDDEISSMKLNNTWELVQLPKGKRAISTKWIFKTKRNNDGEIIRHKARLVARGFSQRYGIDYEETYSPVVRYTSIRVLMSIAAIEKLKIHQMDAVTAYLQGDIDEEIYIKQPEGYEDGTDRVCRLNRSIYGLKQAGRCWNNKLDKTLKDFGLKASKMDPCIYHTCDLKLIIAIYVDDFLIFYKDVNDLEKLKKDLCSSFKMKDMGEAKGCIGIRISQSSRGIALDQNTYIKDVLKRFGMDDCKPIGNPCATDKGLPNDEEKSGELSNIPYRQLVGCLLFIAQATRPDIAFAVNYASRFNNNFNLGHWKRLKRILRYLRGTKEYCLRYHNDGPLNDLSAYVDADHAACKDTRRSVTGYVFILANGAISWRSSQQRTVALSSTEAEYMALSSAATEAIWISQLLTELGLKYGKIPIKCDNTSAISLAKSSGYRPRTKHIDIRHHYVRQLIEENKIAVEYVSTDENIADELTKAVSKGKLELFIKIFGLSN